MMNLCVRGMVVNGDNPKNLVGYIYIGLYAVADFKAVHARKLDLDFSSSSLLLLLLLFVFLLRASLDFSLRLYHYLLRVGEACS